MKLSSVIEKTLRATSRNYKSFRGVCGVSFGAKISNGEIQEGIQAVQFFVSEKLDPDKLARHLPRHVFERTLEGKVDRDTKIPTDVIELKNLKLCCYSGDGLGNQFGAEGSIALIFENRADAGKPMLISCSHVATDLVTPDDSFELSGGGDGCFFQATTTAHTTVSDGVLEFDIALAEITEISELQPLELRALRGQFTDFLSPDEFNQGDALDCQSSRANDHSIEVQSSVTTFKNVSTEDAGDITVNNLYACRGEVAEGDSGGLVYFEKSVVGIIVAKADDGWVFIHALNEAIDFLQSQTGVEVGIFAR